MKKQTVNDILSSKSKNPKVCPKLECWQQSSEEGVVQARKCIKGGWDKDVEEAMVKWFVQQHDKKVKIWEAEIKCE